MSTPPHDLSPGPGASRAGPDALRGLLAPAEEALPLPRAADRSRWDPARGALDVATVDALVRRAEADLGRPWPWPSARALARYTRDGDREEYQDAVFARQDRLSRAVVAAATTLDGAWVDEVADGTTLLLEQTTWCWPAHDDAPARGRVAPDTARPFLDLGAAEVVSQLAWLDHLLGDQLDAAHPGLRGNLRAEVDRRVLRPFCERRDWHWLGTPGDVHNWNPWIHGAVVVAALALLGPERDEERRAVLALALAGLRTYLDDLPADGAIDEGPGYWWNGACRALEDLDLLAAASDGRLGAVPPALAASVAFPHRMHLGGDWYANVADASARAEPDLPWRALHRAAEVVGDDDARRHAAAHRRPGEPLAAERQGLGRLLQALADPAWTAARPTGSPLPRQAWFPSTQVLVARREPGTSAGLAVVAKGGHNGENHNHNDVGAVAVALDGVPVLVDVGRPTYTAATFGPDRYTIWTMQSSWHGVPEVRGTPQAVGRDRAARGVGVRADATGATTGVRMDLAAAYPRDDVRSWWREVALDRERDVVEVVDRWDLEPAPGATAAGVLHLVLAGEVEEADGAVLVRPVEGGGRRVRVTGRLLTDDVREGGDVLAPRLERRLLDDPLLVRVWGAAVTRLALDLPGTARGAAVVTVEVVA
ncbi:heparinase II/III family protein [Pseudokineococcus marinus]|uniref:Heparinase II/III-like C-terminal domain-containing protein n=1 Tax=Pseudokineococcus marinus TaxID=351215 RepID=A0A849BQR5_9ACTN|nr:heparinase II/III family protein [Pseudokineococcus marinus]NNH23162.1 hypothetical protein [Pseudokineococcus marinus]